MMRQLVTPFDSHRLTGNRRLAASWRASVDAIGSGVRARAAAVEGSKRFMSAIRLDVRDRSAQGYEGQQCRTSMSGSRPLDRRRSGAESRGRAGTP
jgi:hypothetical protein